MQIGFLHRGKVAARAATVALAVWLLPTGLTAQDKVSRPGQYSGWSAPVYDGHALASQYVAMRDGTRIAVDIIRPTLNGVVEAKQLPVLWMNFPYNRRFHVRSSEEQGPTAIVASGAALALVKFGYVIAIADMRGNYASFGRALRSNRTQYAPWAWWDAYDITEWLAVQPWSDGKIGMWGCSAAGHTQWQAAATRPPHLRAIFPMSAPGEYYDWGGITPLLADPAPRAPYPGKVPDRDWGSVPVDADIDGRLLATAKQEHRFNLDYGYAPFRDSASPELAANLGLARWQPWLEVSTLRHLQAIADSGIAAYQTANYGEDIRVKSGLFVKRASLPNPIKTMLAPDDHCDWSSEYRPDPGNAFNITREEHRWFDYWLKGVPNGIMAEPSVFYHTLGAPPADQWRFAWQWPLPTEKRVSLYFGAGSREREGGLTADKPTESSAADRYTVDYAVTTANIDARGQTYTSPAFAADTTLTGHSVVRLWVSSTASDGDFVAWIEDVAPDGKVTRLPGSEDGRLRASHRALGKAPHNNLGLPYHRSFAADVKPLVPGVPAELVFDMAPVSYLFRAGHRIRIALSGVAASRRGEAGATPVLSPAPVVTFHRDAMHPSRIELPLTAPVTAQAQATRRGGALIVRLRFPVALDQRYLDDVTPGSLRLGDAQAASWRREGAALVATFSPAPPGGMLPLTGAFGGKYDYGDDARFAATVALPR